VGITRERGARLRQALPVAGLALVLGSSCVATTETRPALLVSPTALDEADHVHSTHCGHYLSDEGWSRLAGHVHGADCGHRWVKGTWRTRR